MTRIRLIIGTILGVEESGHCAGAIMDIIMRDLEFALYLLLSLVLVGSRRTIILFGHIVHISTVFSGSCSYFI